MPFFKYALHVELVLDDPRCEEDHKVYLLALALLVLKEVAKERYVAEDGDPVLKNAFPVLNKAAYDYRLSVLDQTEESAVLVVVAIPNCAVLRPWTGVSLIADTSVRMLRLRKSPSLICGVIESLIPTGSR